MEKEKIERENIVGALLELIHFRGGGRNISLP
jgi:hypothetical protein